MASLTFRIHTNITEGIARELAKASTQAEHTVAVQAEKDTEPYMPADSKTLINDTKVIGGMILYPGPKSRYLYYGKLMVDPETRSAWAQKGATKVLTGKDLQYRKDVNSKAQSHWFEASKANNLDRWMETAEKVVKRELGK